MKSLFIILSFCIITLSVSMDESAAADGDIFTGSTSTGGIKANDADNIIEGACYSIKQTILHENNHLPGDCPCNPDDIDRFKNCLTQKCTAKCEKDIDSVAPENQMYQCEEANGYLKHEKAQCLSSCSESFNHTVNVGSDSNVQALQSSCADENQRQIQKELAHACKKQLKTISQSGPPGATLVCEGGCENYCAQQSEKIRDNCSNTNTAIGLSECQKLQAQIEGSLPQDPNNLPKGQFEWRKNKCEMGTGTKCEQEIVEAFNNATTECNNLKDKAILCCDEPLKCTDEETQELLDSINKQGASSSGISENCRKVKEKLGDIGNIVQKMAAKCDTIISSCKEHCNTQITETVPSVFKEHCSLDLNTEVSYDHNKHTCSEDLIKHYVEKYIKELAPVPAQCESKQEKADQMAQHGEEVLKSALSAAKCEEQARAGTKPSDETQVNNTGAGGLMKGDFALPPVPENELHSASLPGGTKGLAYEKGLESGTGSGPGSGPEWNAKAATQSKQNPGQSAQNNNAQTSRAPSSKKGAQNNKKSTDSKNIAETDPKNPKDIAENKSDEKAKDIENDASKVSDKNMAKNDPENIDQKEHVSQNTQSTSQSKHTKEKDASSKTKKKGIFSKLKALFSKDKKRDVASNKDTPNKEDQKTDQKKDQKKEAAKKDKKNKKGIGLRKFTKADAKKDQKEQKKIPHWTQIKPRSTLNIRTSKYGSPHDNIFRRVSTRIVFMCRTDRIVDCQ